MTTLLDDDSVAEAHRSYREQTDEDNLEQYREDQPQVAQRRNTVNMFRSQSTQPVKEEEQQVFEDELFEAAIVEIVMREFPDDYVVSSCKNGIDLVTDDTLGHVNDNGEVDLSDKEKIESINLSKISSSHNYNSDSSIGSGAQMKNVKQSMAENKESH